MVGRLSRLVRNRKNRCASERDGSSPIIAMISGLDLAADLLTVVTFAIATFKIFSIFVGNGGVAPEWVD